MKKETYTLGCRASEHFASKTFCIVVVSLLVPRYEASLFTSSSTARTKFSTVHSPLIDVTTKRFLCSEEDFENDPRRLDSVKLTQEAIIKRRVVNVFIADGCEKVFL